MEMAASERIFEDTEGHIALRFPAGQQASDYITRETHTLRGYIIERSPTERESNELRSMRSLGSLLPLHHTVMDGAFMTVKGGTAIGVPYRQHFNK